MACSNCCSLGFIKVGQSGRVRVPLKVEKYQFIVYRRGHRAYNSRDSTEGVQKKFKMQNLVSAEIRCMFKANHKFGRRNIKQTPVVRLEHYFIEPPKGLTTTKDKLNLERQQRKLIK